MGNASVHCPKEYVAHHLPFNPIMGNRGGSMIYVRHDNPHNRISLRSHLQVVSVEIFIPRKYTVCSIYLPPNVAVTHNDILSLFMYIYCYLSPIFCLFPFLTGLPSLLVPSGL